MNVGEMQRKLSLWATQDKNRKFYGLYDLLTDPNWLLLAHDYVAQNAGSVTAGCDGITMKDWDENLTGNQEALRSDIVAERFEPSPVRRVCIPKPDGRIRPLGIPAIRDRITQEALRMALEPIFEADFSQYSFGFRPTRCTMDAIRYIQWSATETKKFFWVIEGDISSYFDTINHRKLIRLVGRRVKDRKILHLIWKFLRAGVLEKRTSRDTKRGTPQGGILSPLLANIYPHELDRYMERYTALSRTEKTRRRNNGEGNFTYARYADDFVVLSNGGKHQVEQMREELSQFLKATLLLELSKEKTKITHLNDGFNFLGFRLQRRLSGQGKMTVKIDIPQEAMDKVKTKIHQSLAPTTHKDSMNTKILAINRLVRGWCQYYKYTSRATTQFHQLEYYLFWEMAHWIGRKFELSMPEVMRRFKEGKTLANGEMRLIKPDEFKSSQYRQRFFKPNPYLTLGEKLTRENLPWDSGWTGREARPGMADLRSIILERDAYTCQRCGKLVTSNNAQVDHIRPVRRFKRPVDANVEWNLQTTCIPCHKAKTEIDRRAESRMR